MDLAKKAIGSILRFGLAWASGWLVREGIWEAGEAEVYVAAAAEFLALAVVTGAASLGWSLWEKYRRER